MMPILRRAFLPSLLLCASGCDNVGRVWDRDVAPTDPDPTTTESIITEVPVGGDVRDGRPKVRTTYPSGGGWPTSVPVVVEFNESVNEASIGPTSEQANDARLILRVQGTTQPLPCLYNFLAEGRLLVMRPLTGLSNDGVPTYEVVLLPETRDCDGVRFDVPDAGTVLAEFQVNQDETIVDGRILAMWPQENAGDFAREGNVVVVFDRPATLATVTPDNLQLRTADGVAVAADIERPLVTVGVPDGRVFRLNPTSVLAGSTEYQLVVDDTILFGADGKLDFRGRTPFSRFDTVGPQAPTRVQLHAPEIGFEDKVNSMNVGTVVLDVDTPADTEPGDGIRVRIYGGDKTTQGVGDLTFLERTAQAPAAGVQTVSVDFSGQLGTATNAKFDDGTLTFAAQMIRGSQTSGFIWHPDASVPAFDVTLPTVTNVGPPGSADGKDQWFDTERVALYGVASESLSEANLTAGGVVAPKVSSDEDGRFLVVPIGVPHQTVSIPYSLTVRDTAGNFGIPVTGNLIRRGVVTGTLAGQLTVQAYDEATLQPIEGATVLVDNDAPIVPAVGTQGMDTTGADGQVTFDVTAASHTVTIVRAGYDLVTLYTTQARFVSLPLRPATGATATWKGTVQFQSGPGVTAIVGNTALASRGVLGVRTTNAAPETIPDTPIVANRLQLITGFSGVFEPTSSPPFSAFGAPFLGASLTQPTPTPPGAPAAGGSDSEQDLRLVSIPGQITDVATDVSVNFALATDLDTLSLIGGAPRVRVTASLAGFEGQALLGLGWVTPVAGAEYTINSSFSTPIALGLAQFAPLFWRAVEAEDSDGRVCRTRDLITPPIVVFPGRPFPIPTITSPPGPSGASPAVSFVDGMNAAVAQVFAGAITLDVTATDSAGRRWVIYVVDRDAEGGTDTVQFPDLVNFNVQGLAAGDWRMVVERRLWSTVEGGGPDDFMLTERVRTEVEYSRSAPVILTIQ